MIGKSIYVQLAERTRWREHYLGYTLSRDSPGHDDSKESRLCFILFSLSIRRVELGLFVEREHRPNLESVGPVAPTAAALLNLNRATTMLQLQCSVFVIQGSDKLRMSANNKYFIG